MHKLGAVEESIRFIKGRVNINPRVGIVLGTGLGAFVNELRDKIEIPYRVIPHFVESTVAGHAGKLVFGYIGDLPVVMMAGRFHYYEGYSLSEVTFPIRVLKHLGISRMFITNVSGSLQTHFKAGDLLLVNDHINMLPVNPLRGPNDERLGPRFPDMTHTYDLAVIEKAVQKCKEFGLRAHQGVYVAVPGPSLETKAERIFLQRIGADAVGMSTVPEVIVCKHMSLPVNVFSMISNEFNVETSIEEVMAVAQSGEYNLRQLIKSLLVEM